MELDVWFGFIIASVILTATPGPSVFLGITHALMYVINACSTRHSVISLLT